MTEWDKWAPQNSNQRDEDNSKGAPPDNEGDGDNNKEGWPPLCFFSLFFLFLLFY
jgi:hypothetical protein